MDYFTIILYNLTQRPNCITKFLTNQMTSQLLTLKISIIILRQTVYSAISLINGNTRRSKSFLD